MVIKKLQDIANILKRDSLNMTSSANSGHPTSCMSCAEIMSCLFFNEMSYDIKNPNNPDNDEFILSKGHASPILYSALFHAGCIKHDLMKLRKINSPLEGHPKPSSLSWIKTATGSLGQGLSVGVGIALASKMQKRKLRTYVLLGDSEIAEGSVYEALQLASFNKLNNLVTIIDINRLGQRGETMLAHKINSYEKRFKGFGFEVISINGHDIKQILNSLKKAKKSIKPVVILAKTYKGKGVSFLEDKEGKHGKTLNNEELKKALIQIPNPSMPEIKIKTPKRINFKFKKYNSKFKKYKTEEKIATRNSYGDALAFLGLNNSNVIAIDAEVSNSTYSNKIKEKTPKQFIESYVAEQNMVGMAQGLSIKGYNVFASSFASFLSRAYDQIRMCAISSANLTFCGSHCGVSIGEDGPSQMGLCDISMFRALPESYIFYPSDSVSCFKLCLLCSKLKGIKYIRTTRAKTPTLYKENEEFKLGDFKILKQNKNDKIVLAGSGITLHESLKAHEELKKKKINSSVVDLYCIRPFNSKKFIDFLKKHGNKLIICEDHYKAGGIGEMIKSELINSNVKIKHLCINELPKSGEPQKLLDKFKISSRWIIKEAMKF
jgi:transketolase